jgi:hypothetical protein
MRRGKNKNRVDQPPPESSPLALKRGQMLNDLRHG